MDESNKQLIGEVRTPIPCKPGQPARVDDEYVRNGVVQIFMEVEPLAGKRHVAVTERRTMNDWAQQIKQMLDDRYPEAIKVRLVMDNLNTHKGLLFMRHYRPVKQGAWPNDSIFITHRNTEVGSTWQKSSSVL